MTTELQNVCLTLDRARQERKVIKLFLSPFGSLRGCSVSPRPVVGSISSGGTHEIVTLEQILQKISSDKPSRVDWNLIQRMNLSFNVASSLLQLYSTPWLPEAWTKRTICFRRCGESSQASDIDMCFEPTRPFIVHTFSEAPAARPTYKVEPRYQLLNLGILLLEIRHERSFETWASSHRIDLDSSYGSRFSAASKWLRDSIGEMETSYHDAAARCIEFTFQTHPAIRNWDDSAFRKAVCELVLKPLWTNCSTTV